MSIKLDQYAERLTRELAEVSPFPIQVLCLYTLQIPNGRGMTRESGSIMIAVKSSAKIKDEFESKMRRKIARGELPIGTKWFLRVYLPKHGKQRF